MSAYNPYITNYDKCTIHASGQVECYCYPIYGKKENFTLIQIPSKKLNCTEHCQKCREYNIKNKDLGDYLSTSCHKCSVCQDIHTSNYYQPRSYPSIDYKIFEKKN